jgi:hypothetical protein
MKPAFPADMNTAGNSGKRWSPRLAFFAITAVWTALCMIGCEKASDPDTPPATDPTPLTLAPPTTTLSATQTVAVLTARGGTPPYAWRTSDSSLGTVPDTDAATVTYTRTTALGAQVIRVEDRNRWTAESVIRQE